MSANQAQTIHGKMLSAWIAEIPVLKDVASKKPTFWQNPAMRPFSEVCRTIDFSREDVDDAADRLQRFAPYIGKVFPETSSMAGLIESPLVPADALGNALNQSSHLPGGSLYVKLDSELPISGSIKARGGIYEVLKLAEAIAIGSGYLLQEDDYRKLDTPLLKTLFSEHTIVVGSTGNLGLSVGIMGRQLGFRVVVHMSSDAWQWKKQKLRVLGATVIEHEADYSVAVARGRDDAAADPRCHFVDDESSRDLFLGYAVAGLRLKEQFAGLSIAVDSSHPLVVYLPCGVGGGPGGVAFGLKLAFGDNVHCYFGEPTDAPAMLVGLTTGLHEKVSAADFGVEGRTIADGLAVSRPSGLVCRAMEHLVSGIFTTEDNELYRLLALAAQLEGFKLEPSAVIGFSGLSRVAKAVTEIQIKRDFQRATHLVWATGGSMVPQSLWESDRKKGARLL